MTEVVITSVLAPMMGEPNPRAELVSQMVMGESGVVQEERDAWLRVTREVDGYAGWVHRGYSRQISPSDAKGWRDRAGFRSDGAEVEDGTGWSARLPLLARVAASSGGEWELASGRRGRLVNGSIQPADEMKHEAARTRTIDWATARFSGAPYAWGGLTPWGVDCSGLVQTTYAARGLALPRDSSEQANHGVPVAIGAIEPGDLLFFSESGSRISHVAMAGGDDTLVHSTLACGGFIIESWRPGSRAARLREQLVAIRRISP